MPITIHYICPICGEPSCYTPETENDDDMEFELDSIPKDIYEYFEDLIYCGNCDAEFRTESSEPFEDFDNVPCVSVELEYTGIRY